MVLKGDTERLKSYLALTVKSEVDVAVPSTFVTVIGPLAAPMGTEVVIEESVKFETIAWVLLKVTFNPVALKLVPLMVTVVPTVPCAGLNPVIDGGFTLTVTVVEAFAVPPRPVAVIV